MLIRIHGEFTPAPLVPWIRERAARLGLDSTLEYHSNQLIEVTASGHEILVDALALACTLGPVSATIDDVETLCLSPDADPPRGKPINSSVSTHAAMDAAVDH